MIFSIYKENPKSSALKGSRWAMGTYYENEQR